MGRRVNAWLLGSFVTLLTFGILLLAPKLMQVVQLHANEEASLPSPPAPTSCPPLSREHLLQYAANNTVMITFTDSVMFSLFGRSWLNNVRAAGITYWVLAVADERTAQLVLREGAWQCFLAHELEVDNLEAEFEWGSNTWKLHTWQKVVTVRHVHQLGFNVLHSDLDVVWFRNPLSYFTERFTLPDYMVSMDPITTRNPIGDDGPELGVTVSHYMNTGVYFLRNTTGGSALIDKWYEIRKAKQRQGFHDQDGLYKYLTEDSDERIDRDNRLTYVVDEQAKLAQLPATQFQNGYSHGINQIHKVHKLQPFEAHFVWVWGNNNGKIHRMREGTYFHDPREYYLSGGQGSHIYVPNGQASFTSSGSSFPLTATPEAESSGRAGFLSVDLSPTSLPEGYNEWRNIENDTAKMVMHHLDAVERQLAEVYQAFAIAYTLNRTLILPKMQCFCIQNWFENPLCRLPGETHTQFPITCPADYVFDMNKLYSVEVMRRRVPIREFSFLDNPRRPQDVPLTMLVAPEGSTAANSDKPSYDRSLHTLELPRPADDAELAAWLSSYQNKYHRVHVPAPLARAFSGFKDPALQAEFDEVMDQLPVKWCCTPQATIKANPELNLQETHQFHMRPARAE